MSFQTEAVLEKTFRMTTSPSKTGTASSWIPNCAAAAGPLALSFQIRKLILCSGPQMHETSCRENKEWCVFKKKKEEKDTATAILSLRIIQSIMKRIYVNLKINDQTPKFGKVQKNHP